MKAGDLVRLVLEKVGDIAGDRYSVATVLLRLDLAQIAFNEEAKLLRGESQLAATADTTPALAYYTVPTDCHMPIALELDGEPITFRDRASLRSDYTDWRNESGTPLWFLWGTDVRDIRLVPYPSEEVQPYLEYLRTPAALAEQDEPEIPVAYHEALAYYAAASLLLDYDDYADPTKAQAYMSFYQTAVGRAQGVGAKNGVQTVRRVRSGFIR